jgi:subtilisin family serine protease
VDFVNMSLQSSIPCGQLGATMETAINTLRSQGVLAFIAAGNHAVKNQLSLPGCIPQAITVGASYDANIGSVSSWKADAQHACTDNTTAADMIACWSDSADGVDLLAPGASISSTGNSAPTSTYYGTSQAAPHAAAVAALLLSAKPALTPDEIETRMEATGTLLTDDLNDADSMTNRTTPRIDARVAILADGDDTDGDGCSNAEEMGPELALGGSRNPLNPYDFYDVNGDKIVDLFNDVFTVAFAFGFTAGDAGYSAVLDRGAAPPNANPWDLNAPDGAIDLFIDIFGTALQFGSDCTVAP